MSDVKSWETMDVSVERLEELLVHQCQLQLAEMVEFLESKEIDPAWDMAVIYEALTHERLAVARRRSAEWISTRASTKIPIDSLDRAGCAALERELRAAPAFLAATHTAEVAELSEAVRRRGAELDELARRSKVAVWEQAYLDLSNIDGLNAHTTARLLERIRTPPCELRPEEQSRIAPIATKLTVHLDRLSLDELLARIERLREPQQRQIFDRLAVLLSVCA